MTATPQKFFGPEHIVALRVYYELQDILQNHHAPWAILHEVFEIPAPAYLMIRQKQYLSAEYTWVYWVLFYRLGVLSADPRKLPVEPWTGLQPEDWSALHADYLIRITDAWIMAKGFYAEEYKMIEEKKRRGVLHNVWRFARLLLLVIAILVAATWVNSMPPDEILYGRDLFSYLLLGVVVFILLWRGMMVIRAMWHERKALAHWAWNSPLFAIINTAGNLFIIMNLPDQLNQAQAAVAIAFTLFSAIIFGHMVRRIAGGMWLNVWRTVTFMSIFILLAMGRRDLIGVIMMITLLAIAVFVWTPRESPRSTAAA